MRRPSWWKLFAALVLVIAGSVLLAPFALRAVGHFLVIADPLEPSDAIVVMAGEVPFRQIEAARLFQRGLAPRVVLTRERLPAWRQRLKELGLGSPGRRELAAAVLERLNVSRGAIILLDDPAINTVEELASIRHFAVAQHFQRIIIVSSPDHMRRIRVIWSRTAGSLVEARLHPAPEEDGFDPNHWWTSKVGAEYLFHEYFGILEFLLGSPLRSN
jgi:uncharacterized SAM-binding protein YcdF (DUF218 family)